MAHYIQPPKKPTLLSSLLKMKFEGTFFSLLANFNIVPNLYNYISRGIDRDKKKKEDYNRFHFLVD